MINVDRTENLISLKACPEDIEVGIQRWGKHMVEVDIGLDRSNEVHIETRDGKAHVSLWLYPEEASMLGAILSRVEGEVTAQEELEENQAIMRSLEEHDEAGL